MSDEKSFEYDLEESYLSRRYAEYEGIKLCRCLAYLADGIEAAVLLTQKFDSARSIDDKLGHSLAS